ncbi:MAG TPA: hypothetical protein PLC42_06805 [Parachlamydiaceae bacterium]|nr:hypothetical protein [Parachlamydiaceae bacterium]
MLRFLKTLFFALFFVSSLMAGEPFSLFTSSPRSDIPEEDWQKAYPFLLPEDSEMKQKLDAIFENSRATLNSHSLIKAGFSTADHQKYSLIVVTRHKDFPGYIFKLYLDNEKYKPETRARYLLTRRALGSSLIQKFIDEHDLGHMFQVPKKWIYLLPEVKKPLKKYAYKNFIVVEEEMDILEKHANKRAWKEKVTKEMLLNLYQIVKEIGLVDCVKIDNIPFATNGKITFVDTEAFTKERPVTLKRLKKSLSHSKRAFWERLID